MSSRTGTPGVVAFVAVVFLLAAALTLGGCSLSGGGTTTATTQAAPTTTTEGPTTTTEGPTTTTTAARLKFGDTGTWQGVSVSADAPQLDTTPVLVGEGDKVVYCMVTILNNSKDPFDYNGLDFTLYDTAHQEYDNAGLTSVADVGEGTLAPGGSVQGAVGFEMPMAANPSGLDWQPSLAPAPVLIWGQP